MQICKLMKNTIGRFEIDHKYFTPVSSIHSHYTRFSKKSNFVLERPKTLLGLNSFRYLGTKLWSRVPENIINLKKMNSNISIRNFCWVVMVIEIVVLWIVVNRLCLVCCLALWVQEGIYIIFEFFVLQMLVLFQIADYM